MTLEELNEKLEEAGWSAKDFQIAASFDGLGDSTGSSKIVSGELKDVLICENNNFLVFKFVPTPAVRASLELAEAVEEMDEDEFDEFEDEDLGIETFDLEDPNAEGLAP